MLILPSSQYSVAHSWPLPVSWYLFFFPLQGRYIEMCLLSIHSQRSDLYSAKKLNRFNAYHVPPIVARHCIEKPLLNLDRKHLRSEIFLFVFSSVSGSLWSLEQSSFLPWCLLSGYFPAKRRHSVWYGWWYSLKHAQ